MTTAQQVLDFEGARLGQGGDETWAWYPLPRGTAWCMAFQSMALSSCGIPTKWAWVSACFDTYRSEGRNSYDIRTAQPGDLVAFEWGSTPNGYDHVAMIIALTATGAWTRNGNVNGSKVQDLWFPFDGGGMAEIARPAYATPPPPTPPTPSTHILGDDDMIDRFLARAEGHPEVFLVAPGLGFRWHLTSEDRLRSAVHILNSFGGKILRPPATAKVDIIAGQPVWVMNPADLAMIPVAS